MNAPSKFTFRDSTGRATNRKSNPFRRAPARGNCRVAHLRRCDFTRFYFFFFFFSLSFFIYLIVCFPLFFFKFISIIYRRTIESFESDGSKDRSRRRSLILLSMLLIEGANVGGAFDRACWEDRKLRTFVRSWIKKEKKRKNIKKKTVISQQ